MDHHLPLSLVEQLIKKGFNYSTFYEFIKTMDRYPFLHEVTSPIGLVPYISLPEKEQNSQKYMNLHHQYCPPSCPPWIAFKATQEEQPFSSVVSKSLERVDELLIFTPFIQAKTTQNSRPQDYLTSIYWSDSFNQEEVIQVLAQFHLNQINLQRKNAQFKGTEPDSPEKLPLLETYLKRDNHRPYKKYHLRVDLTGTQEKVLSLAYDLEKLMKKYYLCQELRDASPLEK